MPRRMREGASWPAASNKPIAMPTSSEAMLIHSVTIAACAN